MAQSFKQGLIFAISAYLFWGLVPLYFKLVASISAFEVLAHRILWSVVLLAIVLLLQKRLKESLFLLRNKKNLLGLITTSALMTSNWMIFIYAIAANQTLESSYGYFISPLIIIALGIFVLKEKVNAVQLVCLALAILGVAYQMIFLNSVPWIALSLAISFGLYSLTRKKVAVGPIQGVFLEALIALPVALILFSYTGLYGEIAFLQFNTNLGMTGILALAGFITAAPLLLFAESNKRLPLSINGFLQYITPTMHFALAILVFNEPMSFHKLISFSIIWVALALLMLNKPLLKWIQFLKNYRRNKACVALEKCQQSLREKVDSSHILTKSTRH